MGEFQFCITREQMGLTDGLEVGRKEKRKIWGGGTLRWEDEFRNGPGQSVVVTCTVLFWACELRKMEMSGTNVDVWICSSLYTST